ncbi:hypothetical protein [Calidifontibacter terrae]
MIAFSSFVVKSAALGMGPTFILLCVGFIVLFVGLVMLGEMRGRNRPPAEPFDTPVLLRNEQKKAEKKARRHPQDR